MMNQEDIFKKIGQILNELNDQYQYLAQNPQELNELELELFLANANFLSDHVQIIRKLNNKSAQKALPEHTRQEEVILQPAIVPALEIHEADDEPAAEAPQFTPSLEEDIFKPDNEPSPFEFILNEKTSDKFEFEEKSVDEIFDRPLSKEEELIIAQKQKLREKDSLGTDLPEDDEIGPEPFLVEEPSVVTKAEPEAAAIQPEIIEIQPAAASVTEFIPETEAAVQQQDEPIEEEPVILFTEPVIEPILQPAAPEITEETPIIAETPVPAPAAPVKLTLNDILSGNTQSKNYQSEKSRMVIQDLKQAISLNDKLRYIKDLFNGYNLAYAEAIDLLNKMPDFKSADYFLQKNYAVKNNWSAKQETADQFYELLHQRFPD